MEEGKKGMGANRKRGRRTAEEEKQNSEGCSVREGEREEIRSPSFCEHHPPVSYTRFLSQPLQTP